MTSILVQNVSVDFRIKRDLKIGFAAKRESFRALNDISFSMQADDHVGILGHNGSGKTTLLRVLSGVLPASEGKIEISGQMHAALSLRTGLLNQASCLENIRLRAYQYGYKGTAVTEYVDRVRKIVDLDEFLYQPLKTLSNGMRSRLMIGMFLMNEHSIIIFDEWVGVLDRTQLDGVASLRRLIDSSEVSIVAS